MIRTLCQSQDAFPRHSQLLLKAEGCSKHDSSILLFSWGMLRRRHASWNAYPTGEGKIFPIPTVFFYFPKYNSGNSCCWQYQLETIVCVWNISVSSKKGPIQFEKYPFHLKTCVILYEKKKSTFTDESLLISKFIFQHIARWQPELGENLDFTANFEYNVHCFCQCKWLKGKRNHVL